MSIHHESNSMHHDKDDEFIHHLYRQNLLSRQGRDWALINQYTIQDQQSWLSRLFFFGGSLLTIFGFFLLFSTHWHIINASIKLLMIELMFLGCLIVVFLNPLDGLLSQSLLLFASLLIGVFWLVFSQIYPSGSLAYKLFFFWSLSIIGWTAMSRFSFQWLLWLVLSNVALILWSHQSSFGRQLAESMLYFYLVLLNGTALLLREYIVCQCHVLWLSSRWTRVLLGITVLVFISLPIMKTILNIDHLVLSAALVSLFCLSVYIGLYIVYRHRYQDIWLLSAILFFGCLMLESVGMKTLSFFFKRTSTLFFLLFGVFTITVFALAINYVLKVLDKWEANHDSH